MVSIVIPVYNGEAYVRQAIDSALAQKNAECEVIAVNDGSNDQTADILKSYGDAIRVINKPNGGTSSALNAGIKQAMGEFVAWLSHDDVFLPGKSAEQVFFLNAHSRYAACYTDYEVIDERGMILTRYSAGESRDSKHAIRRLFSANHMCGCSMLIRRAVFKKVGLFREELKYTQDLDMWFRILEKSEIGYLPEVTERQRVHQQQQGRQGVDRYRRETVQLLRQTFERLLTNGVLDQGRPAEMLWLGDVLSSDRNYFPEARRAYFDALRAGGMRWAGLVAAKAVRNHRRALRAVAARLMVRMFVPRTRTT